MTSRTTTAITALRVAFGLMATLAGLDKFVNLLADWPTYVAPVAAQLLPVQASTLMAVVGVVEVAVGLTILIVRPMLGSYVAAAWLVLVSVNLVLGGHLDIAVRDVVLAISAFTLATLLEETSVSAPQSISLTHPRPNAA